MELAPSSRILESNEVLTEEQMEAVRLELGLSLVDGLFGYDAVSTRVPVYAFIFLVALGIDYNIILVSRFTY